MQAPAFRQEASQTKAVHRSLSAWTLSQTVVSRRVLAIRYIAAGLSQLRLLVEIWIPMLERTEVY